MTASLANGLAFVFNLVLNMVQLLVIASVVVSWVGGDPRNQLVQMVKSATEPIYRPLRRLTSRIPGQMDWAPFAALLVVVFLQKTVVFYLMQIAHSGGF